MKLHLPVRLFRAVLTVMMSPFSVVHAEYTRPNEIIIPEVYQENQITVDAIIDVTSLTSNSSNVAFLISAEDLNNEAGSLTLSALSASLVSNSTGSWYFTSCSADNLASLIFSSTTKARLFTSNKQLTFENLNQVNFSSNKHSNSSGGGCIYTSGIVNFKNNQVVEFLSNSVTASTSKGGAIWGYIINLADNGSVRFKNNKANSSSDSSGGAVCVTNNGSLSICGNNSVFFESNYAMYCGGAIYGFNGSSIVFDKNNKISFSGNYATKAGAPCGGAIYSLGNISFVNNKDISFAENYAKISTQYDTHYSYGGAIYSNSLSFIGNQKITFDSNYTFATVSNYYASSIGGALYASNLEFSNNVCVSFTNNYATGDKSYSHSLYGGAIYASNISFCNNGTIVFDDNFALDTNHAKGAGGALYITKLALFDSNEFISFTNNESSSGGAIFVSSDAILTISNNDKVEFKNNNSTAIYGSFYSSSTNARIVISGNSEAVFSQNASESTCGAIYAYSGNIIIADNNYVLFEKNSVASSYLRSVSSAGTAFLSSCENGKLEFRDSIAVGNLVINELFVDENGIEKVQLGDVIFTGTYVNDHLKELKKDSEVTSSEITNSLTSIVQGETHVYDGKLSIEDGAVLQGKGIIVHNSYLCTPTLQLKNGHLNQSESKIIFQPNTIFSLIGINSVYASELDMKSGSILTFNVTSANISAPNLDYTGTFSFGNNLTVNISFNDTTAEAGLYKLMSVSSITSDNLWTEENITVNGLDGYVVSFDDLEWVGNTLYLNYSGIPGTGEEGENSGGSSSIPALYVAMWANASGDGVWNTSSENWTQDEVNYAYKDGVQVIFGDTGAGNVTLVGELAPSEVLVDSSQHYTWIADTTEGGNLTGSMELTKKGSGTLTINCDNAYTGGTAILGGSVIAGSAMALGSSAVRLTDATLIIKADGFANILSTSGNSRIETQDNGSIVLSEAILNTGNLTINGNIDASALQLNGTISTYVDASGHEGESGFMKAEGFYVQVVSGGTVSGKAVVSHGSKTLTLGSDGYATLGGGINYDTYHLTGNDSVSVKDAETASGNAMSAVKMAGGSLYADATTTVEATAGNIFLSDGVLSGAISGASRLSASGTAYINSTNSHTGGTIFTDANITLLSASALGNGSVMTMGNTALTASAKVTLNSSILNSGMLTLGGLWDISALSLKEEAATYIDTNGHSGSSGFFRSARSEVQVVQGGTSKADNLILTHTHLKPGVQLVLGCNGVASAGGVVDYSNYLLTEGDSADVSDILGAAGGKLDNVTMTGGNLTVDDSVEVDATGGKITITDDCTLSGSIKDTDVTLGAGDYKSDISADITGDGSLTVNGGDVTLSGNNSYTGGTTVNGGNLTIGDGTSLGTGDVIINGGTLDLNDSTIGNDITLNNGNLVGGDNYNGNLSIGGDNVTVEGGYTLSAGNVLEIAPGGTAFGSDLTLAGGTLLFKGAPLTVDGEVSFAAGTTTLVDLRQWEGQLVDGLTLAVLGSGVEGWSDGCLELIGMSDMSLLFDSATGTLTLQVESEQPIIEVPTITWLGAKNTVWQHGKAGWMNATTGYDAVYENGAEVIFTQSGAVTIAGAVAPGSIIVAGDKAIAFKSDKANPGRIVGETSLIKRGNGQLTLNDGNSYTGGTFIEAGTVVAGGAASFGSGAITISGGTLDLKGKAVLNDIALIGAASIKNGKTFGGELVLDGELLKGSTLNIAEKAEIKSGLINGTLSGVGTVTVSGEVSLGTTGKLTTNGLEIDGSLAVSSKGLAMNSKTSAITVHEGGSLISDGVIKAYSMEINGGSVDIAPIKASSVTLTDSLHLNNAAMMNLNGKLSAKGSVTIEGDYKLILSGALSAKNLTLGSGDIYMTSTKLQTIKVSNELTLNGGTDLNFGFSVTQKDVDKDKAFKILTFKVLDAAIEPEDLYNLLGLSKDICTLNFDKSRKSITLVVEDYEEWNKQAEAVRNGELATAAEEEAEDMLFAPATTTGTMAPELEKAADSLVQSTWGTVGASRAFGETIANRGTHATLLEGCKGAAWISTMGGSSRISSEAGHAGADYTLTGAAFGIEANLSADSTLGIAIGNSWGKVSTFSAYPVDQDSTHAGIYGNHKLGDTLSLRWMAAHTRTESDVNLADMLCTWSQDALQLDARLTWAKALNARTSVNAFGGLQYLATDSGECNGIKTGSLQNLRAEIGVGATHRITGDTMAYGELSFIGDVVRNNPTADLGGLRSHGTNPGRAGMNLSVGAIHRLNDDWSVNATYNLELMQNITSHSLNVGATYSF